MAEKPWRALPCLVHSITVSHQNESGTPLFALHRKTTSVQTAKHIPWLLLSAFLCYLSMAMPLSSLALHVTVEWGMSNFMAGIATGAAFVATLLCRKFCGDISDSRGGKYCFLRGCACYCIGSCICLAAALEALPVPARFTVLILGRIVVGIGESLCNMGINHWSMSLINLSNAGRTMANIGMSVYLAVGVGGQTGYYLYRHWGFLSLMIVSTLTPIAALIILRRLPSVNTPPSLPENRISLTAAMTKVWLFGVPALLYSTGFGVLAAFLSKSFLDRGWPYSGWGLTCWGFGFVCMRAALGHLPDRKGGCLVAAYSGAVGVTGLIILPPS